MGHNVSFQQLDKIDEAMTLWSASKDPDRDVLNISMYEITDCEKGFFEKGLHLSWLCKISCYTYCLSSFNKNIDKYSALQKDSLFKYLIIATVSNNLFHHFIASQNFSKSKDTCVQNSGYDEFVVIVDESYYWKNLKSLLNLEN